jgi:hypothetical protein
MMSCWCGKLLETVYRGVASWGLTLSAAVKNQSSITKFCLTYTHRPMFPLVPLTRCLYPSPTRDPPWSLINAQTPLSYFSSGVLLYLFHNLREYPRNSRYSHRQVVQHPSDPMILPNPITASCCQARKLTQDNSGRYTVAAVHLIHAQRRLYRAAPPPGARDEHV